MLHRPKLADGDAYTILSNPRRRETVETLLAAGETEFSLRDLSELVASREAGCAPAPRPHRASVYNALHQTHQPKLHALDIVDYDPNRKLIRPQPAARSLSRYLDTVACFGLSWDEYYRLLGIVSLCLVVGVLAGLPVVSAVDPLVVTSIALGLFALSTAYQLYNIPLSRWSLFK